MLCEKCGGELEMGYGLAGGHGMGPYVFCTKCNFFEKFQDSEMEAITDPTPWAAEESIREAVDKEIIHARQVSEDARQVRKKDEPPSGKDKGG